jgi:single-stranded-DNA-specific exonuclease
MREHADTFPRPLYSLANMMYVRDTPAQVPANGATASPFEWIEPEPLNDGRALLHADTLIHAILMRRIGQAGDAEDFLDSRPRAAPDPHLLPGMTEVADRIAAALRRGESIGIFGDYDTDGVTSTALLTLALRAASGGAQPVAVRLPQRREGYGLSEAGVDDLGAAGVQLLIAVDCGSKDHAAVARARQRGMDVVIIDHHRLNGAMPEEAIVASAQLREDAPYRSVSAAGIAYLLATALAGMGLDTGNGPGQEPVALLDLAMIGLIGDVSPLTGVNRALVRDGLRQLRNQPRAGLRALAEFARSELTDFTSTEIAFQVSPRLNAPGRLGDPRPAYELLITRSRREATRLAELTERANQQRKVLQDRILRDVEAILAANPRQLDRRVLVFAGSDWEPGIVGLVASKLAQSYDRPVVMLSVSDGVARGSGRSVPGFDITGALSAAAGLLLRHGGHERAAGLVLEAARVVELDEALQHAVEQSPAAPPGPARLLIDAHLDPARLRLDTVHSLQALGPFGEGNPVPLLRVSRLPIRGYSAMGRERQHLKIHTAGPAGNVDAILWGGANRSRELLGARHVDIVGNLESNVWNGTHRVQLRVLDFRPPA